MIYIFILFLNKIYTEFSIAPNLYSLIFLTVSKIEISFLSCNISEIKLNMLKKVPVLPIPAEQWIRIPLFSE